MRKLEGLVKEIQKEMDYLKQREIRFQGTNGKSHLPLFRAPLNPCIFCRRFALCVVRPLRWYTTRPTLTRFLLSLRRIDQQPRAKLCTFHVCGACLSWDVADIPPEEFLPEEVFD